jgi:hypothetical protein
MVAVVSAVVLVQNQGVTPEFISLWLKSFMTTWPVAFLSVLVVAPMARRFVNKITAQ